MRGLDLLRRARDLRGLSPVQVGRIAARLAEPVRPSGGRRLRPALVAFLVLLFAGTALAWATGILRVPIMRAGWSRGRGSQTRPLVPAPMAPVPSRSAVAAPPTPALASSASPVPNTATRAPLAPPRSADHGRARTALALPRSSRAGDATKISAVGPQVPAAKEVSTTPVETSRALTAITRESESLASVQRLWRHNRDAAGALVSLDEHDRRFRQGQMALESRLLRVEILIEERRNEAALAILDGLPLADPGMPRSRELLTVRGELRVRLGRCADARRDLELLARGSDGLARRARDALTHCPSSSGGGD